LKVGSAASKNILVDSLIYNSFFSNGNYYNESFMENILTVRPFNIAFPGSCLHTAAGSDYA